MVLELVLQHPLQAVVLAALIGEFEIHEDLPVDLLAIVVDRSGLGGGL
jgi:hypothetical protein